MTTPTIYKLGAIYYIPTRATDAPWMRDVKTTIGVRYFILPLEKREEILNRHL